MHRPKLALAPVQAQEPVQATLLLGLVALVVLRRGGIAGGNGFGGDGNGGGFDGEAEAPRWEYTKFKLSVEGMVFRKSKGLSLLSPRHFR